MTETILTPTVMWSLLATYIAIGCVYLFVLKEDVVPLFLSIFVAIPFWIYGPRIESHFQSKAALAEEVTSSESAGTTLAVQTTSTSGSLRSITSFETEKAIYRVHGNHTVVKGVELKIQTRADGSKFLCNAKSNEKCMKLLDGF